MLYMKTYTWCCVHHETNSREINGRENFFWETVEEGGTKFFTLSTLLPLCFNGFREDQTSELLHCVRGPEFRNFYIQQSSVVFTDQSIVVFLTYVEVIENSTILFSEKYTHNVPTIYIYIYTMFWQEVHNILTRTVLPLASQSSVSCPSVTATLFRSAWPHRAGIKAGACFTQRMTYIWGSGGNRSCNMVEAFLHTFF